MYDRYGHEDFHVFSRPLIISVPSVVILTCPAASLWGSIRFNTPMLFATAFLPMFAIGLTGLPLSFNYATSTL